MRSVSAWFHFGAFDDFKARICPTGCRDRGSAPGRLDTRLGALTSAEREMPKRDLAIESTLASRRAVEA
jgi:hypothetical protein